MRVTARDLTRIGDLIRKLYTQTFTEELIRDVQRVVGAVTDSQYVSFCNFFLGDRTPARLISTNPPDYIPLYLSVRQGDFLLRTIVSTGKEYWTSRDPRWNCPEHQGFLRAVQSARPVSDIVYLPLKCPEGLVGHCGMSRGGLGRPHYSDSDLAVFRFITGFVDDAFQRSWLAPPLEDDVAHLDYQGNVVKAGLRIGEIFDDLFGPRWLRHNGSSSRGAVDIFLTSYSRFLRGPLLVGMDRVCLRGRWGHHTFVFSFVDPPGMRICSNGFPYVVVRLLESPALEGTQRPLDLSSASRRFGLTPRECDIIRGVYAAKSNKVIALELGIDESTVKRHTHNIYEKTGLRSRVELVKELLDSARKNQPKL